MSNHNRSTTFSIDGGLGNSSLIISVIEMDDGTLNFSDLAKFNAMFASDPPPPAAGDTNLDGQVNFNDLGSFVMALTDPAAYWEQIGSAPEAAGDLNRDGTVDFKDLPQFTQLLLGPSASSLAVGSWDAMRQRLALIDAAWQSQPGTAELRDTTFELAAEIARDESKREDSTDLVWGAWETVG